MKKWRKKWKSERREERRKGNEGELSTHKSWQHCAIVEC